jgi:hypothetical protein
MNQARSQIRIIRCLVSDRLAALTGDLQDISLFVSWLYTFIYVYRTKFMLL